MKSPGIRLAVVLAAVLCPLLAGPQSGASNTVVPPRDYPIKPVPFTAVHLDDVFWAPRIEPNRKGPIPFAFQKCEETGRVANFLHAGEALRGQISENGRKIPLYPFDDTATYKV